MPARKSARSHCTALSGIRAIRAAQLQIGTIVGRTNAAIDPGIWAQRCRITGPSPRQAIDLIVAGDLTIDPAAHTVTCAGRKVDLGPKAFELLRVLSLHCGQGVSVNELLQQVWGAAYVGEPQVVYVHIRWLREKLEEDCSQPKRIITVHGIGYKLAS